MKVNLAINNFDPSTTAAFDALVCKNAEFVGTAAFLRIIRKWWTIMNIKTTLRGVHQNDPDGLPFRSINDPRIGWLISFANWLDSWNLSVPAGRGRVGCMTCDMHFAMRHHTLSMVSSCVY